MAQRLVQRASKEELRGDPVYGPGRMVLTPWGQGDSLRERRLAPGPGTPREEVIANQRERLFGAMVASVAARGYQATRVADLVELSGVSSRTFYDLFADKRACFLEALDAIIGAAVLYTTQRSTAPLSWDEQAVLGDFEAFAEMFVIQPAAARMCLVDVYAAGPEAVERVERSREGFQRLAHEALRQSPERAAMPAEMIRAYMGAMQEITRTRLLRGTEDELASLMPQLWKMMLDYRPPPQPLRLAVRSQVPGPGPEGFDAHDHAERALRALTAVVAEQGYAETTITDVVKRASMSRTTFYSLFADKEDALLCAIDSGGAQLVAAVAPAVRRAPDWAHGIRAGFGALLSYLAHHPAFARLVAVEVFAAGLAAVERRAEAVAPLEELLAKGYERSPDTPPIAVEAIAGGVHTLIYEQIRRAGPQSLPELAPLCTYIALAPFIGAQEACEVANSSGRRVRGSD